MDSPATDVYGGSAYGYIGFSNESDAAERDPRTTKVTLNSGNVNDIYGGSMGSDGIIPLVNTYSLVTINGGTAASVYGGSNINAQTSYRSKVIINGGFAKYVYGGSNRLGSTLPTEVILEGGNVENLFGGSNVSGNTVNNNVKINGGTASNVYGGNNAGGIVSNAKVTLAGGNVGNVYGCGKGSGTSCLITNVLIAGISDTESNIFGGGEEAATNKSKVLISSGKVGNIFGGNNKNGNVQSSNVYLNGGYSTNVYGGNNINGETINSNVFIGSGEFGNVYGGGYEASTVNATVEVIDGTVGAVFGGGNNAAVENPILNVHGGNLSGVYGGSNNNGTITNSTVNVGTEYIHIDESDDSEESEDGDDTIKDESSSGSTEDSNANVDIVITEAQKALLDQVEFSIVPEANRGVHFDQYIHNGSADENIKGYPYFLKINIFSNNTSGVDIKVPFKIVIRADSDFEISRDETFQYYLHTSLERDAYGYYFVNNCRYV